SLSIGRTWRGTWSAQVLGLASEIHDRAIDRDPVDLRLVGPGVSLAYSGFESTAYAGQRRGAALAFDAAWYPAPLALPEVAITDLRGQLDLALPVPGLRRPTVHLGAVVRDLVSSTSGLLELGGIGALASLFEGSTNAHPPDFTGPDLPPLVRFAEVLRG